MRQSSAKAIGWLVLVTATGLFWSALYRQGWDAWTEQQLRKNAEPQPFALLVLERYGPQQDADEVNPVVAVVQSGD
jgi:hypothetical protein